MPEKSHASYQRTTSIDQPPSMSNACTVCHAADIQPLNMFSKALRTPQNKIKVKADSNQFNIKF